MTCSVESVDGFTRYASDGSLLPDEEEEFVIDGSFQEGGVLGR